MRARPLADGRRDNPAAHQRHQYEENSTTAATPPRCLSTSHQPPTQAVDMWTKRLNGAGPDRGQRGYALPTARPFDHMPTATLHD
jgi:hypothetical protein